MAVPSGAVSQGPHLGCGVALHVGAVSQCLGGSRCGVWLSFCRRRQPKSACKWCVAVPVGAVNQGLGGLDVVCGFPCRRRAWPGCGVWLSLCPHRQPGSGAWMWCVAVPVGAVSHGLGAWMWCAAVPVGAVSQCFWGLAWTWCLDVFCRRRQPLFFGAWMWCVAVLVGTVSQGLGGLDVVCGCPCRSRQPRFGLQLVVTTTADHVGQEATPCGDPNSHSHRHATMRQKSF